jgi:hypothetical protein
MVLQSTLPTQGPDRILELYTDHRNVLDDALASTPRQPKRVSEPAWKQLLADLLEGELVHPDTTVVQLQHWIREQRIKTKSKWDKEGHPRPGAAKTEADLLASRVCFAALSRKCAMVQSIRDSMVCHVKMVEIASL